MEASKNNQELVKMLEIFANACRLAILEVLKNKNEMPVGRIADRLRIPFNTASKNLLYLEKRGILKRRYDGNFVLYSISNSLPKLAQMIISDL